MDYLLQVSQWSDAVMRFAEQETKRHSVRGQTVRDMCADIVRFVEYTRIKQYNLFTQQRGAEFDKFKADLLKQYPEESVARFFADDEMWRLALELGEV